MSKSRYRARKWPIRIMAIILHSPPLPQSPNPTDGIDPSLWPSSAQKEYICLGINPYDLDESQASLANRMEEKIVLIGDGNTSKWYKYRSQYFRRQFWFWFPSAQKIMSTWFSRSVLPSQTDMSTPPPIKRKTIASCSSNPSQLPNAAGLKLFLIQP